jgi:hypothetical protein
LLAISLVAGLAVIGFVVHPVLSHNWVMTPMLTADRVSMSRVSPTESDLGLVAAQKPLGPATPAGRDAVLAAGRILSGQAPGDAEGPDLGAVISPADADLTRGESLRSLAFSSLYWADLMIRAYQVSREDRYLLAARDRIVGYARYERHAWRNRGYLWNDHAIAARVGVVIRFWSVYRGHRLYDEASAQEVLAHAVRGVRMLAEPSHFTGWSNHGVMQNVALLQAAAAFPSLIDAHGLQRLAFERLALQWQHYVSDEGVVLEHSAGYHADGLALLDSAYQLASRAGLEVPAAWPGQIERAKAFLARITRPDGTLAAFGDTRVAVPAAHPAAVAPLSAASAAGLFLYPKSGYAIHEGSGRDGPISNHTVLVWSNFPGQAHKQGDELGVVLWGQGRGWVTPIGYAPYGSGLRAPAEAWLGSNAPHGLGERHDPAQPSALADGAADDAVALLDAWRGRTAGGRFERQVAVMNGQGWVIVDQYPKQVDGRKVETLWTFYPDLVLSRESDRMFSLKARDGQELHVRLASSSEVPFTVEMLKGSMSPFGGWVAAEDAVRAAPALRVSADPGSSIAIAFEFAPPGGPLRLRVDGGDRWRVDGTRWQMFRDGRQLHLDRGRDKMVLSLQSVPEAQDYRARVTAHLQQTVAAFPKYRDLDFYRLKLAAVLSAIWTLQVVARGGLRLTSLARSWRGRLDGASLLLWALAFVWVACFYLPA